jgi:hypothetical protein
MNAARLLIPSPSIARANEARALTNVRSQAAFVRALLDEVERVVPRESNDLVSEQLVEELARLGCRFLDVASKLTTVAASSRGRA